MLSLLDPHTAHSLRGDLLREVLVLALASQTRDPSRSLSETYETPVRALGKGKTKEAAELLRVAIDKGERTPQMDQPLLLEYRRDYTQVLRQLGKKKEAAAIEQRANQVRASSLSEWL